MTFLRRTVLCLAAAGSIAIAFGTTAPAPAAAAGTTQVGGVLLDGWGGLHTFGGFSLNRSNAPYWSGWDIARAIQVLPDGSGGWTLDGWGGLHAWGTAPAISTGAYWPGWDIARAFHVLPDMKSGYVMDGWGGLHPFGPNAPRSVLAGAPYWPGWDVARGLDLHWNTSGVADGGMVVDAWGGMHTFGNYQRQGTLRYYPGHNVYQQVHSAGGKDYAVGRWGVVSAISSGFAPYWNGYSTWSGWDIERDIAIFGANNPTPQSQPITLTDWNEYEANAGQPYDVGFRPECGIGPGARYAGSQVFAVSLECQAMTVYGNGSVYMDTLVTTGRPQYATPRGWTRIYWKRSPWWVQMNYPASYPVRQVAYAMAIDNHGDLFHDAAWEPASEYGQLSTLYTQNASHGCIHVQRPQLDQLYAWTAVGATVYVN